ncbi:hypothetical protein RA307_07875 [Xanthobacteraceae bacterium Astr-EGSB]|uniref:hypothetical protein n=1 Tax=Astrobacterium formosum TaxID=3069710 RepID=UPI0027ADC3EF|nr:hypothetical protein [Xanthobacteraceae bacterium Astr-EGSB]
MGNTRTDTKPAEDDPADRDAVATYIATLTGELARLARKFGYDALGYILDMARMEAENLGRGGGTPSAGA